MANRTLRACLIALVLINLVFVQLTGAARPLWLLVLGALTLGSPLLIPLREKLIYRGAWNLGVMGVFAMLVHHATGDNLTYVLADGLVLAAMCQVHLLNNLRSDQRPDLLFLNSFLIAIVTGYLSQDMVFAAAFAVYAPVLVASLCIYGLVVEGGSIEPAVARRVAWDGLVRSAVLMAVTLSVFALWPRDFQRKGILASRLDFHSSGGGDEIGFSDSMSLEQGGKAAASDKIVMGLVVESGSMGEVPSLWRGATLMSTNGDRWWPLSDTDLGRGFAADPQWRGRGKELVRGLDSAGRTEVAVVTVSQLDPEAGRLFTPLDASRLVMGTTGISIIARGDGTLEYGEPGEPRPSVTYTLGLSPTREASCAGATPRRLPRDLEPYIELPDSERVRGALDLASELALEVSGADQHELVTHFSDYLSNTHAYLPPGAEGAAADLDAFLDGAPGHCEFFAAALAIMLRSRGVPCRIATGYRGSEWSAGQVDGQRTLTFRRRDAHAWVEVLDPAAGWYAVDPNPAPAPYAGPGFMTRLQEDLALAWEQLTAFDSERRGELLAGAKLLPGKLVAKAGQRPGLAALELGALLLLCLGVRAWRRRKTDPSVREYDRALRRAGLAPEVGETPRELLRRAESIAVDSGKLEALRAATELHELARYR